MIEVAAGLGASVFTSAALWAYSSPRTAEWEARGFTGLPVQWKTLFLLSTLASISLAGLGAIIGADFWQMTSLGLLGWMTTLVTVTDLRTYKIPREPSVLSYWLGIPLMLGYAFSIESWAPLGAFGVWMIIPTALLLFSRGGIGMGDVRLLILFGTTLSWWIGIEYMFYALIVACVLQLILFAGAVVTGKGKRAAVGELMHQDLVQQGLIDEEPTTDTISKVDTSEIDLTVPTELVEPINSSPEDEQEPRKESKKRLHLPFGPALMIAYTAAGVYAATRTMNTCDIFMMFLCM